MDDTEDRVRGWAKNCLAYPVECMGGTHRQVATDVLAALDAKDAEIERLRVATRRARRAMRDAGVSTPLIAEALAVLTEAGAPDDR